MADSRTIPITELGQDTPLIARKTPAARCWHSVVSALFAAVIVAILAIAATSLVQIHDLRTVVDTLQQNNNAIAPLPNKWAAEHVPPRTYQENRGTCWVFTISAFASYQYRAQGIKRGFLTPEQYMPLSEQAMGISFWHLCQEHKPICVLFGDHVNYNISRGGETVMLMYFANHLANKMLPVSVCPYPKDYGDETCPGMDKALQANPLQWRYKSYQAAYSVEDVKALLVKTQSALMFGTTFTSGEYYLPCTDKRANVSQCNRTDDGKCQIYCPAFTDYSNNPGGCCWKRVRSMYNMEGEYLMHHNMPMTGGHAMLIAGYNDDFQTSTGERGVFILRNTWHDGMQTNRTSGSHSIDYIMGRRSRFGELSVCPNSRSPRNWYACDSGNVTDCLDPQTREGVIASYMPMELECSDAHFCTPGVQYYLKSRDDAMDGSVTMCFFAILPDQNYPSFCLDPMVIDDIANIFYPARFYDNSEDECGFYVYPYSLFRALSARYGGVLADYVEMEWDDQSYAANAAQYPSKNYDLVRASTRTQTKKVIVGPWADKPTQPIP